jgi:heme oxygenase
VTLLQALRSGTRQDHERLEASVDVLDRCRTPGAYAALLQDFRSLYAPLERALAAAPVTSEVLPDWADRRKTVWLDEDLAALDAAPVPDRAVPALASAEDVAGACYVLEGATLGGAVVVRSLAGADEHPPPHRFFSSYGDRRGAMWSRFRGHLRELDARGADRDRTVAAAREVFRCFEQACR